MNDLKSDKLTSQQSILISVLQNVKGKGARSQMAVGAMES